MSPAIRQNGLIATSPKLAADSLTRGGADRAAAAKAIDSTAENCPVVHADAVILGNRRGLRVVCFGYTGPERRHRS